MEGTTKEFILYPKDRGVPLNGIKMKCEIILFKILKEGLPWWPNG